VKKSLALFLFVFISIAPSLAQTAAQAQAVIPNVINYSGVLKTAHGAVTGVTFLLYRDEQGGAPLWIETQNVAPDASGRYSVHLGAASNGLPADLFQSGEARWLAIQPAGEQEQPRVLLVAVPYAMKAADAQTLGGLPPSAFVLAAPPYGAGNATSTLSTSSNALPPPLSGTGTTDFLPLWTSSTALGSSALFQTGSGSSAKIGINTTTPQAMLDVNGTVTVRSLLNLPAISAAKASAGARSNQIGFVASAFNSSTNTAVNEVFRWQAEPAGNNTSSPSATMNLLFGTAPSTPTETGLKINHNGQITFAAGQTFPDAFNLNGTAPGFLGLGANTSGNGNELTVSAGSSASGASNATGGDLFLTAGNGTGSGGSGAVHIQTAASGSSGTTANTMVDRYLVLPDPFPMSLTSQGTGPAVLLNLAPFSGGGFKLHYTVFATDGTDGNTVSETGTCVFSGVSDASNAITVSLDNIDTVTASLSNTPVTGCGFRESGGEWGIFIFDNLSFTPTTHIVYYQVENVSGLPITILTTPSGVVRSDWRTTPQNRRLRIARPDR